MRNDSVTLYNGLAIPRVFFGTYRIKDKNPVGEVVENAYAAGYRAFDSASYYGNEELLGRALLERGVFQQVLLTTKVWNDVTGYENVRQAFEKSEKSLGRVDIFMLHWPAAEYIERWRALEDIYLTGRVKAIGVSNFKRHHLETLFQNCRLKPMIDQIEAHAYFMDKDTIDFCLQNDIAVQAWRPLMRTGKMLENPEIAFRAGVYGKTAAQMCLRFLLQSGLGVVPKSVRPERMVENLQILDFSLSETDMAFMRSLNTGVRTADDPDLFILPK